MRRYANRVRETCTVTGDGAVTLTGAVPGYLSFAQASMDYEQEFIVCVVDTETGEWEIFIATSMPDSTTIARGECVGPETGSSNLGGQVSFQSGTAKEVFVVQPGNDIFGHCNMKHWQEDIPLAVFPATYVDVVINTADYKFVTLNMSTSSAVHLSLQPPEGSGKTISVLVNHGQNNYAVTLVDDSGAGFKSAGGTMSTGDTLPTSGQYTSDLFQFTYFGNDWHCTGSFMNIS